MALLDDDAIAAGLAALPGWERDGGTIVRRFTREGGFMGSLAFVNALAEPAEAMDHHPDLEISWNTVTVRLATHSEGGITQKDLALAREIDALA